MLLIGVISIAYIHMQTISIAGDKGGNINEAFMEALRTFKEVFLFCCCKPCSSKPLALSNHKAVIDRMYSSQV